MPADSTSNVYSSGSSASASLRRAAMRPQSSRSTPPGRSTVSPSAVERPTRFARCATISISRNASSNGNARAASSNASTRVTGPRTITKRGTDPTLLDYNRCVSYHACVISATATATATANRLALGAASANRPRARTLRRRKPRPCILPAVSSYRERVRSSSRCRYRSRGCVVA